MIRELYCTVKDRFHLLKVLSGQTTAVGLEGLVEGGSKEI
jgi:hypothetical protein